MKATPKSCRCTQCKHSKMRRFYEQWAERSARHRAKVLLRSIASGPVEELLILAAPCSGRPA